MTILFKILGWIGLIAVGVAYLLLIICLGFLAGETVKDLTIKKND